MNKVERIKELVEILNKANVEYYRDDNPSMSDKEYDKLMDELAALEKETGIVFENTPTKNVGGKNSDALEKVQHTRPMLSAKKTKSIDELWSFVDGKDVVLSWKLDGHTLVLRYSGGEFKQAITRGEHGLVGEDVTHTAKFLRGIPKKVSCLEDFEVRGESVLSWIDFDLLNRNKDMSHPRNTAAAYVRSTVPDKGALSHIDFVAFELMLPGDKKKTKLQQLDFLSMNGFNVVNHRFFGAVKGEASFKSNVNSFVPEEYPYPADGIIVEYQDLEYGRSLGTTAHHENRMIAFKWADDSYETVFRGVDLQTTRTGLVSIVARFDPVLIDGSYVRKADMHSLSTFEKYAFGVGDKITVYKANMIIPQIDENLTRSGTFEIPKYCPCCGSPLETHVSSGGIKNLYCPNENCIARNAQKIARYCDSEAMNIDGINATVLEKLMSYGVVTCFADLYKLAEKREEILNIPGMGNGTYDRIVESVKKSRHCRLSSFLVGVSIPGMGRNAAKAIDEYFEGSWTRFVQAIEEKFSFFHIGGITQGLHRNIYKWYENENERRLWQPLIKELNFNDRTKKAAPSGGPCAFAGKNICITGIINGMDEATMGEVLKLIGANVTDSVDSSVDYIIVGDGANPTIISQSFVWGTELVPESKMAEMMGQA